jgi:hypothetical protein
MVIFCRECDGKNDFNRNWIADDDACTFCGTRGKWRTVNEPKKAYALSENDRRFLRSIRIEG